MPKLNINLIRSVVRDLKNLEKICNDLHKSVQTCDVISWRYPSQMCHNIHIHSIINYYTGSAYEYYLLILELIYDRFQYFLHLIIAYLDMIPLLFQEIDLPRNVVSPDFLSTGALLNMFWTRIQILQRNILESVALDTRHGGGKRTDNVTLSLGAVLSKNISAPICTTLGSFTRSIQTEDCSLIKCESCCMSEDLVQLIVNEIQTHCAKYKIESLVSHEKKNMKQEIFHITQWKAMMKWSEAAKTDLKQILQALREDISHNRELEISLGHQEQQLKEQVAHKDKEILNLKNNVHELQLQLQAENSHLKHLIQEKEKQELEIQTLTESIKKLENDLRTSENYLHQKSHFNSILEAELRKIATECGFNMSSSGEHANILEYVKMLISYLERERNDLKEKLNITEKKLQEKEDMYKSEVEKWDAIFQKEKEKQNALSCELQKMNEYRCQYQDLKLQNECLQVNINETEEKVESLLKSTENLQKELQQKKINEKLLMEYPDLNKPIEIKVCGNPEKDMESQIQANKIRIKLLSDQTIKLEETLHKLKKINKLQFSI